MTQTRRRSIQIVIIVVAIVAIAGCGLGLAAFVSRDRPVFASLRNDVRAHQGFQLLNPFRQRSDEKAAEAFLTRLMNGQCLAVLSEMGEDPGRMATICESEGRLPLQSWRLQARGRDGARILLRYRVSRLDGHETIHDPFWIWVSESSRDTYQVSGYEPWY